jgi:phage terminase small subunit
VPQNRVLIFSYPFTTLLAYMNRAVTTKQKAFAQNYIDPNSPTFGNGTQSALRAGYSKSGNKDVAKSIASETLRKPYVQTYMSALLDKIGLNHEVRLLALYDVITAKHRVTVTETEHSDGSKTVSTTRAPVRDADRIKAIDVLYKVDGSYARAGAEGEAARKEYEDMRKRIMREVGPKPK